MPRKTTTRDYLCGGCRETRSSVMLPRGWHVHGEAMYCGKCWGDRYVIRAVTFPVKGPVDGTWEELRGALRTGWQAVTRLSNWLVRDLLQHDVVRTPEAAKMPAMPSRYRYPEATAIVPELGKGSGMTLTVTQTMQAVERTYRQRRYDVVWLGQASPPSYRYPAPLRIHPQAWRCLLGEGNRPLVSVPLPGRRWLLELNGGDRHRRQRKTYDRILSGELLAGELVLYQQGAGSHHRPGLATRDGGGQRRPARLMVKIVAWLPREAARERTGVLFVTSTDAALIAALNMKGDALWQIHADHVIRWAAEHRAQLQRWSDDQKREERPLASFHSRRERAAAKYRRRIDTAAAQIAAQVVAYANRWRYAEIRWAATETRRTEHFPWSRLDAEIRYRAEAAGIDWSGIGGTTNETAETEEETR